MNPNRLLRQFLALLLLGLVAVAVLQGCAANPDQAEFDNPFDPDNAESANPFDLTATETEGQIILEWNMLDGFGFTTYYPQFRVDGDLLWTDIDTLEAVVGEAQLQFFGASPTSINYFRVTALNGFGQETSTSSVVPVPVNMPPIVNNIDSTASVISRFQTLVVAATAGDVIDVSLDSFATIAATAPRVDENTYFADFDLGNAESGERITVYARSVTDFGGGLPPIPSATGSRTFTVSGAPTIALASGGTALATTLVDLVISDQGEGVVEMRFASSEDGLADVAWQPGDSVAYDVPVLDTVSEQTIWAEFRRDFEFDQTSTLSVQADDLSTADFSIPGLASNRIVELPDVGLLHDGVATLMRVSQYPDFNDVDWMAYTEIDTIILDRVDEQHLYTIFTQYRNHWFQSPVRSDWVILGPGEVRVDFTNPLQDLVIEGGTTIEITGTATTFDATLPITEVAVNLSDDGGWLPATGTENWEYAWDVPLLTEDTRWGMGALARAENVNTGDFETGAAWIYVTISQLTITILNPADTDEVTRGLPTTVDGTAAPFLAGAPLDSVVVTALGERLPSFALENWSVTWVVPEDATELIDIIAYAYAGGDSVSQRIQVTAIDPPGR